jgi:hypothetical protein
MTPEIKLIILNQIQILTILKSMADLEIKDAIQKYIDDVEKVLRSE